MNPLNLTTLRNDGTIGDRIIINADKIDYLQEYCGNHCSIFINNVRFSIWQSLQEVTDMIEERS